MKIEFDPNKNQRNIEERNLPFELVEQMRWTTAVIVPDVRFDYPEPRYVAAGYLGDIQRLYIVCFTPIKDGIRVISFRKANKREVKKYETSILNQY